MKENKVANPFPVKPSEEQVEAPKERTILPSSEGEPILPKVTAAGEWHGDFTVTAPPECKGEGGGWKATLSETAGKISGQFSTDVGISGSVNGTRVGESAKWDVGGGTGGVSFSGGISGNTMSGTFTGLLCDDTGIKSTGTYFGGRIVR